MIKSFWKSKWFEIIVSFMFLVGSIVFYCFGKTIAGVGYLVSGLCWYFCAVTSYHTEQIEALAERVTDLEAELYKEEK